MEISWLTRKSLVNVAKGSYKQSNKICMWRCYQYSWHFHGNTGYLVPLEWNEWWKPLHRCYCYCWICMHTTIPSQNQLPLSHDMTSPWFLPSFLSKACMNASGHGKLETEWDNRHQTGPQRPCLDGPFSAKSTHGQQQHVFYWTISQATEISRVINE